MQKLGQYRWGLATSDSSAMRQLCIFLSLHGTCYSLLPAHHANARLTCARLSSRSLLLT